MRGFEADVQILGRADEAARLLAGTCGEFLVRREVEARRSAGLREFVKLTDDQLNATEDELKPLKSYMASNSHMCGTLSEKLKMWLIESEIAIRSTESSHQRLAAIGANADFLLRCEAAVKAETANALAWRSSNEERQYYTFHISHNYEQRSHVDQTVIKYRDAMGWSR